MATVIPQSKRELTTRALRSAAFAAVSAFSFLFLQYCREDHSINVAVIFLAVAGVLVTGFFLAAAVTDLRLRGRLDPLRLDDAGFGFGRVAFAWADVEGFRTEPSRLVVVPRAGVAGPFTSTVIEGVFDTGGKPLERIMHDRLARYRATHGAGGPVEATV